MLLIQSTESVEVASPVVHKTTPLRSCSRVAHDHVMPFCILTMTISINDMPATKITGLNATAIRLLRLNSFPSFHVVSPDFNENTCIKIRKGDHMINIRSSHTLMIFAITSNKSPTVNKNSKKNLRAKPRVRLVRPVVLSVLR